MIRTAYARNALVVIICVCVCGCVCVCIERLINEPLHVGGHVFEIRIDHILRVFRWENLNLIVRKHTHTNIEVCVGSAYILILY